MEKRRDVGRELLCGDLVDHLVTLMAPAKAGRGNRKKKSDRKEAGSREHTHARSIAAKR
jgi:hypothetical protein